MISNWKRILLGISGRGKTGSQEESNRITGGRKVSVCEVGLHRYVPELQEFGCNLVRCLSSASTRNVCVWKEIHDGFCSDPHYSVHTEALMCRIETRG